MVIVKICPSVTAEQRQDARFIKLLGEAQEFFNCSLPNYFTPRVRDLLCLHEGAHVYFAKQVGATNIVRHGPEMMWDERPQYDCPAISRSSVEWTLDTDSVMEYFKPCVAGYVCRREISDTPNEAIAIGSDIDGAREWFDEHVGTGDEAFNAAVTKAEQAVADDLQSPAVGKEIRAEAKRFQEDIFPTPKLTSGLLRARRLGWAQ